MISKLLKSGVVVSVILMIVFSVAGIGLLFFGLCCNNSIFLGGSNLISEIFKGIGICIAFLGVGFFIEKTKEDYIKENETLHTIIHSERSLQEAYKSFNAKDRNCPQIVLQNFLDFIVEQNPMFCCSISNTAHVGKYSDDVSDIKKHQRIDIYHLFFLYIKNIDFIAFDSNKTKSNQELSAARDKGIFKIELFTGAKFIYCPKHDIDLIVYFEADDEFKNHCKWFEKSKNKEEYYRYVRAKDIIQAISENPVTGTGETQKEVSQ